MRRRAALLLSLALPLLASAPTKAFVRSKTGDKQLAKFWGESCIPVTIYLNGFHFGQYQEPQQSIDAVVKSITAAAHAWSPDLVNCADVGGVGQPYLEIVPTFAPFDAKPPAAAKDHRNSIIFRTDNWTKSGLVSGTAYDDGALAVTTVFAAPDGKILDADIEIHATRSFFDWANIDDPALIIPRPKDGHFTYDLQNSITHEFGHLLGLEHTCFNPIGNMGDIADDGSVRPRDDQDRPIPNCEGAPSNVEKTVMFVSTTDRDTSKRVLSTDEVRFLCSVYPAANDPQMCKADQPTTGCATAPARTRYGRARSLTLGLPVMGLMLAGALRWRARDRGSIS